MNFSSLDNLVQIINEHRLKYKSNVNIYVDTSGSIDESQYMNIIDLIIQTFCKTFSLEPEIMYSRYTDRDLQTGHSQNEDSLNIYSFTHVLSYKTELLPSLAKFKDNTNCIDSDFLTNIYHNIIKPCGGTDFYIVWNNINKTAKPNDINIIITDFEYYPSTKELQNMPSGILYVAVETDEKHQKFLNKDANLFVSAVKPYDNEIENHIFRKQTINTDENITSEN